MHQVWNTYMTRTISTLGKSTVNCYSAELWIIQYLRYYCTCYNLPWHAAFFLKKNSPFVNFSHNFWLALYRRALKTAWPLPPCEPDLSASGPKVTTTPVCPKVKIYQIWRPKFQCFFYLLCGKSYERQLPCCTGIIYQIYKTNSGNSQLQWSLSSTSSRQRCTENFCSFPSSLFTDILPACPHSVLMEISGSHPSKQ